MAEKKPKPTPIPCVGGPHSKIRIEAGHTPPERLPCRTGHYLLEHGVYKWVGQT